MLCPICNVSNQLSCCFSNVALDSKEADNGDIQGLRLVGMNFYQCRDTRSLFAGDNVVLGRMYHT